jgi:dihydroneopterin aldolase
VTAVIDLIELRGLRVVALVGVLAHEVAQPQPLEVDVDLGIDLAAAGASDDLADTVDYGAVCAVLEAAATAGHVALLERLATVLVDAVLAADARIASVELSVRKLRPPVPQQLATSGVRLRRDRP